MTCSSREQKETVMLLNVDLHCEPCYNKVKRVLCKFPQIRNQVYDEKNNTVMITVFCCSPEKIKDELSCKAGKSIKKIEIQENGSKNVNKPPTKEDNPPPPAPPPPQPPAPKLVPVYPPGPPPQMTQISICCAPCYEGKPGPPCYHNGPHGPPYPCGYYGHPCPPPPYCGNRCVYFSEENPASCSLM